MDQLSAIQLQQIAITKSLITHSAIRIVHMSDEPHCKLIYTVIASLSWRPSKTRSFFEMAFLLLLMSLSHRISN